ncbi:hypothetical protein ACFXDE_01855 [Kitasatospora sp. NPDC059408]|uniref:hypothetical protein n=1 Tax=Kitasatospora sp. NPDC059408 TaxID=3346823 RepID=UPI0036CCFF37
MIQILFVLPDDRERTRTMPAVPRVGDHIGWQPDPDGHHEEHTVQSVYWSLDDRDQNHVVITLEDRIVDGRPANGPSAPWPSL